MTIYSQHANRGKVQVLAAYDGPRGVESSTVTSLSTPALAGPIVHTLNRISALASVPLSVFDLRGRDVKSYPSGHLDALTDRSARAGLLIGAHGLWYDFVRLELHQALRDLDDALAVVSPPVVTAVNAELEAEVRGLREALAEYSEGIPVPESEGRRDWDFGHPFVLYDGGIEILGSEARKKLDEFEAAASSEEREQAVADLRILATAYSRCTSGQAALDYTPLSIFSEPYDSDGYFVTICTPEPGNPTAASWQIEVCRWEPDDADEDESSSATGIQLVRCELPSAPDAERLTHLLDEVEKRPALLREWAATPIGGTLEGTEFTVTRGRDA